MSERHVLRTNEYLRTDESLVSPNRQFFAVMKPDGNFAIFRGSGVADSHGLVWGSLATSQPQGEYFLIMQSDGNLVTYRGTGPSDNRGFVWNSGPGQGTHLTLQDNGNLCIYRGSETEGDVGAPLWRALTDEALSRVAPPPRTVSEVLRAGEALHNGEYLRSRNGLFFAVMKPDGNFAVFSGSGPTDQQSKYMWGSTSSGDKWPDPTGNEHVAVMQKDGNFAIYPGSNPGAAPAVWATDTDDQQHQPPSFLVIQDDGNLCLYRGTDPEHRLGGAVFSSMAIDPITDVRVLKMDYHFDRAKKPESVTVGLFHSTIRNNTDREQMTSMTRSEKVGVTKSWSTSFSVSVGVKSSIQVGVPELASVGAEYSLSATTTFEFGQTKTVEETWDFTVPATVPAGGATSLLVRVSKSKIEIPYDLTGIFTLESGRAYQGTISGTFVGENTHDLDIVWGAADAVPAVPNEMALAGNGQQV